MCQAFLIKSYVSGITPSSAYDNVDGHCSSSNFNMVIFSIAKSFSTLLLTLLWNDFLHPTQSLSSNPMTRLSPSESISDRLFGLSSVTPAPEWDLGPNVHPRILFNEIQWQTLTSRYASMIHEPDSWAAHHLKVSQIRGPESPFLHRIAQLDVSSYRGDHHDLSKWNETQREDLYSLASEFTSLSAIDSLSFFMCVFWAKVNDNLEPDKQFISSETAATCRSAIFNWATVLLAHRAYYCASNCSSNPMRDRSSIWNINRIHTLANDWYSASASLALAYDVSYSSFSAKHRKRINSALALLVLRQASWGATESSTFKSPNAAKHPHRIFSNWALYHAYLYITNLVLEHETDFDVYTYATLASFGEETGFNKPLHYRFNKVFSAFMRHSVYPDGSTYEDGYTYFIALLPGSLGLCATSRHGVDEVSTTRFRALIHNLLQMSEPWRCGRYIGHGSGGGLLFISYVAMFKYVYPNSRLTAMLYRQRLGDTFQNDKPCRIDYFQNMLEATIFGGEHDLNLTTASSPQGLPQLDKELLPLSIYYPRRGLVVMRNGWDETDTVTQLDARPDAWAVGHDNADRGVFVFISQRQTWITDLQKWNLNVDSRKHTLLHVDGLAQDEKVPTVEMKVATDDGDVAIAAANLTYGYNMQWARGGNSAAMPRRDVNVYTEDGNLTRTYVWFKEKEEHSVFDLGWPKEDDGADIGMQRSAFALWGDDNITFSGLYTWKRKYREVPLGHVTRSLALVRSLNHSGYLVVMDSVGFMDDLIHVVESYLILEDNVIVNETQSGCNNNSCKIVLESKSAKARAFIFVKNGVDESMDYRVEQFKTDNMYTRVIVRTNATENCTLWYSIHAVRDDDEERVSFNVDELGVATFSYDGVKRAFALDSETWTIKRMESDTASTAANGTCLLGETPSMKSGRETCIAVSEVSRQVCDEKMSGSEKAKNRDFEGQALQRHREKRWSWREALRGLWQLTR